MWVQRIQKRATQSPYAMSQQQSRQYQPSQHQQQSQQPIKKQTHQTQSQTQAQAQTAQLTMEPVNPLRHIITTPILYLDKKNIRNQIIKMKFQCDQSLTGLVVGRRGDNMNKAKQIDGVTDIDIQNIDDNKSECTIIATNKPAAIEAQNILEIVKDFVLVPREAMGLLIGRRMENILKIKQTSNVIQMKLASIDEKNDSNSDYDGYEKLFIIGRKNNVSKAKHLISSHVEETKKQWAKFLRISQRSRCQRNSGGIYRGRGGDVYNMRGRGRGRGFRGGYRDGCRRVLQ